MDTPPKPKDYWIHRRTMAWLSFAAIVGIAVMAILTPEMSNQEIISSVITWLGIFVATWIGGASLVDVASKFRR